MAHLIIYDQEANVAALVDPEAPAALGPIATGDPGEDPRLSLQEFVDGLGVAPESMPTWVLFNEWQSYVRAIVQLVEDEVTAAAEASPDGQTPEPPGETTAAPQAPSSEPTPPAEPGAAPPESPAGQPADQRSPAALSEAIAAAPGTPAKTGEVECWLCHGDLTIESPTGRVECPTCHGKGRVPADAPEATQ